MSIIRGKVFTVILISSIVIIFIIIDVTLHENRVIAKVNGEEIFSEDVDNIYMQMEGTYSKAAILDDLIDEMVVVTKAETLGIEITEEDLAEIVEEYKENLPDIYETGVEIYGEEAFIQGLGMQLICNEAYDKIIETAIQEDGKKLSDEFYVSMKLKNEVPKEMSQEEFLQDHQSEYFDYVYDCWLTVQRKEAEIEIFNTRRRNDDK